MKRLSVRLPLLLISIAGLIQPATRLVGQCCSGANKGLDMPRGDKGDDAQCSTSPMKVNVDYTGAGPGELHVDNHVIPLPAGGGKVVQQLPATFQISSGQKVKIKLTGPGGTPATPDQQAPVSWSFGPKDKKEDCKKEELSGSNTVEDCGNEAKLSGGANDTTNVKCGSPRDNTQKPDGAPEDDQGTGKPCGSPGNLYKDSGGNDRVSETRTALPVYLGAGTRIGWSAGVLNASGNPGVVANYVLNGAETTTTPCTVTGAVPPTSTGWRTENGAVTARQMSSSGGYEAEFKFYHSGSYTEGTSSIAITGNAHRATLVSKLSASLSPAPTVYTDGGVRTRVQTYNETTGALVAESTVTVWNSTGADSTPTAAGTRTSLLIEQEGGVVLKELKSTTTILTSPTRRKVEHHVWIGGSASGAVATEYDETWQLFAWGEELIQENSYPDGKGNGAPIIRREHAWWDSPADMARYTNYKLLLEKHGTMGPMGVPGTTWHTGSWQATWTEAAGAETVSITLRPWKAGGTIPSSATTLATLQAYAASSADYVTEKTTTTSNGQWLTTEKFIGGSTVARTEDTATSETLSAIVSYASTATTFLVRTEHEPFGDFYMQPLVEYELRAGETNYWDSQKLISKSSWFRQKLYPDAGAPANVLLATPSGTGMAPWMVEWRTRREFPESSPTGYDAETDSVIKTAVLTERQTGNVLAELQFLSSTDASSADTFPAPSGDTLLETKLWTYDSANRPVSMSVNGITRESWSYSNPTASTRATVHIDEDGLQTTEVRDLLERLVSRTIHANGTVGQNDVVTTWTHEFRSGKPGRKVTESTSGGGAWVRVSIEEYDGIARPTYTRDAANIEHSMTYTVDSSGDFTKTTKLLSEVHVTKYINVAFRGGEAKSRGGNAVVEETFNYGRAAYTIYTYRSLAGSALTTEIQDGMQRTTSVTYPVSGTGTASTTFFNETVEYDVLGRVAARKIPTPSGTLYEVHTWSRIGADTYAHDSGISTDTTYDNGDAARQRIVRRIVQAAPYGGASLLMWEAVEQYEANGAGIWHAAAAASRRVPLQEAAMTINSVANQVPLEETNDGGMRTITAENRDRPARTVTLREWKNSATLYRSVTVRNGLLTTFTGPEQTAGLTLDYTPLREPLAEASFENYPYWPRVNVDPATGRVLTTRLPRRAAGAEIDTGTYTYYLVTSPNAGRVASYTDSSTGGVTYYNYNNRGQLTHQWGSGTYPQMWTYDNMGRRTQLDTWRTIEGSGVDWTTNTWPANADTMGGTAKASTTWNYIGLTDLLYQKTYPDAGLGNRIVSHTYNTAGRLAQRTAQRLTTESYTYDGYARVKWVDYSGSTSDVEFTYNPHSGRTETMKEGSLAGTTFAAHRTTTYGYRSDGSTTSETITDTAGATILLQRNYDSMGRRGSMTRSWTQAPTGTLNTPTLSYNYDTRQRLSSLSTATVMSTITATITRTGSSASTYLSDGYLLTGYGFSNSFTRDIYGRVTSHNYSGASSFSATMRWNGDRLVARGKSSAADRWEYRYNSKGEMAQSWKQLGAATTVPTTGEVKSGTGSTYTYDDIGNRGNHVEVGRGTVGSGSTDALAPTDTRTTTYTANILNQYTGVGNPQFFNVQGIRSGTSTIVVNGDTVDTPTPTAESGYQPGGTGTYFRDEVPNTAPAGTSTPDIYEAVKVTQNGNPFSVDDPIQYVPRLIQSHTYDLDGNLLTDGRWTYTWDAADRLIRMESVAWSQPATGTAIPAATVPSTSLEFGYDGFGRRIRKKVHTKPYGSSTWTLASWEAFVYDGWNMVTAYNLTSASAPAPGSGTLGGVVSTIKQNYIWGPDIGSKLDARRDWQAAGGVGGLITGLYVNPSTGAYSVRVPAMDHMGNALHVDWGEVYTGGSSYNGTAHIYDYDAFGKEVRSTTYYGTADSFPFRYSTKYTDGETGLNYYGYRYYDPAKGRWLNRDPIGEDGGLNLYGMVGNDPVNSVDVLGELGLGQIIKCALKKAAKPLIKSKLKEQLRKPLKAELGDALRDELEEKLLKELDDALEQALGLDAGDAIEACCPLGLSDLASLINLLLDAKEIKDIYKAVKAKGSAANNGASSAVNKVNLEKQLASQEQLGQLSTGGGTVISQPAKQANRIARQTGRDPANIQKVSSDARTAADGQHIETHSFRDASDNSLMEPKTVIDPNAE
jgi:RHS repeat-associated protein